MVLTIMAFFFVLGIVVLVHELGHFIVAKMNGIFVLTFSFGFGPKLIKKRIGETEYAVSALPFGGYVKFAGESEEEESKEQGKENVEIDIPEDRLYRSKSPLQKMCVVLAGPLMNALLALMIYIFIAWFQGLYVTPSTVVLEVEENSPAALAGFRPNDRILEINGGEFSYWEEIDRLVIFEEGAKSVFRVQRGADTLMMDIAPEYNPETGLWKLGIASPLPAKVGNVKRDSPAEKAGIRPGARILSINDTTVTYYRELQETIHSRLGISMKFAWSLDGEIYSADIIPAPVETAAEGERLDVVKIGGIGIGPPYEKVRISFLEAIEYGSNAFFSLIVSIVDFLGKLFTGKATVRAVGGPLRVGIMAGDMLRWGFSYLIYFLAFFSLNLAIFNLLPILPFDGGHFVLYCVELVLGRRIDRRIQNALMHVGFIILIALMVFILFVDVFNIFR